MAFGTFKSLEEVIRAYQVAVRQADGAVFALSQVDDFAVEVELLKNNPEFMAFLRQLSQDQAVVSIQDLRKELAL